MIKSRSMVAAVVMASAAIAGADGVDFNVGADLRIRQEIMGHVPGLPGGGVLYSQKNRRNLNHMRFRPDVWGEIKGESEAAGKWRFFVKFTDEFRWNITPKPRNESNTWPGEVVVDNLFIEAQGLFDGLWDFKIGRQDLYGLYGLDHVFVDGTPSDGSRTTFTDMARFCYHVDEDSTLDFFALYNFDDNPLRWGTDRSKHSPNTGHGGNAGVDMDDWGCGVVWGSKLRPWLPYQVFAMHKNTLEYIREGRQVPWTQRELGGVKLVPQLNEEWSLQLEGMGQVGVNGEHTTLSGWSTYSGVNWKSAREGIKPFGKVGYHFMSGDDDAATEDGGHSAWDPMWARGVNDSELFLYGTHYGSGWWSNMHYFKTTAGLDLGRRHTLTASAGPLFAAAQDGLGGGNGYFKGFLSQLRYDIPIWLGDKSKGERWEIFVHVLAEFFNPGDYFETKKPGWFIRWQVEFRF